MSDRSRSKSPAPAAAASSRSASRSRSRSRSRSGSAAPRKSSRSPSRSRSASPAHRSASRSRSASRGRRSPSRSRSRGRRSPSRSRSRSRGRGRGRSRDRRRRSYSRSRSRGRDRGRRYRRSRSRSRSRGRYGRSRSPPRRYGGGGGGGYRRGGGGGGGDPAQYDPTYGRKVYVGDLSTSTGVEELRRIGEEFGTIQVRCVAGVFRTFLLKQGDSRARFLLRGTLRREDGLSNQLLQMRELLVTDAYRVVSCMHLGQDVFMPRSREGGTRGFGFLTFSTAAEAEEAADRIDGMDVDGRPAKANIARARPPRPGDFGGRGGGGRGAPGPSPKIYVGNLPMDTSEADLEDLYRDYGPIRCVVSPCLTPVSCPFRSIKCCRRDLTCLQSACSRPLFSRMPGRVFYRQVC